MAEGKINYSAGQIVVCASEAFLPKEVESVTSHLSIFILQVFPQQTNNLWSAMPFHAVAFPSFGRYEWKEQLDMSTHV